MRTIGLLGGMSFEGSATYYRLINEGVRERLGGLNAADIAMRSVNFARIAEMQRADQWDQAGDYLAQAARGLEQAGAQCMMICAVTMHLVAEAVEQAVEIPFIHIIDETAKRLSAAKRSRPLLLATKYTMENGFYQDRMKRQGIDVIVPDEHGRALTHAIIFDELCQGKILASSRESLIGLIDVAREAGADSVIFGCTEIGLILDPGSLPIPAYDSTVIHAEAAVEFALDGAA